jgi:cobyrinic acid a,c-diamide synthase
MGLFDGTPSAADIAERFNIPVMALIDAGAMAQTFGAVAHGLATYRPNLPFAGVLANRVGSARHTEMLCESLPAGMGWFGALPRSEDSLPERHLGLMQAAEIDDLAARLDKLADALAASATVDLPKPVNFLPANAPKNEPLLAGKHIAIARDAAYGFIYPANLETLSALGAELHFFSPVAGDGLPECDAVWLPGGYPELHAKALSNNHALWKSLKMHVAANKPLFAECGGMMSLFEQIVDKSGVTHNFAGILPGKAIMQKRLAALGMQVAELPEGRVTGHTFHYSKSETPLTPIVRAQTPDGREGEPIYRHLRTTASYVHIYFPSNPAAIAQLFSQ